jgi:hypothetical protein
MTSFMNEANEESKIDPDRAMVFAVLANAQAIHDLADAIRELKQDFITIEVMNADRT